MIAEINRDQLSRHMSAQLEDEIEREHQAMLDAKTRPDREYHAAKVRELVAQRSPERVAEMEKGMRQA